MAGFLFSETMDGYTNLARDEFLLNSLPAGSVLLHLYINRRAVIIGRNQNPWRECDLNRLDAEGVQLVRRVSGGGAVYHDEGNLNFSFICSGELYDEKRQTQIILCALEAMGIRANVTGRNDMEADGRKFSGNAYCQRGRNRQRHGTLLIASDLSVFDRYLTAPRQKLAAKGVSSVRARVCNLCELAPGLTVAAMADALKRAYEEQYGKAEAYAFSPDDRAQIERLRQKHASWEWRMGEAPAFDYTYENHFSWGMAQLCMSVENGKISRARLFTDALDTSLPGRVEPLLAGLRFSGPEICEKLCALEGECADLGEYMAGELP